ncbi:Dimethylmenaquinone methyltransferase [Oceanicola granulosus HTCC2516]|uniref:Putative 4-hydroxy-4-methyl-2-oxoglutarate aldolase n=1 Tax=Oceanicola granulosus (strain ATCC BAA-861 / DSM 15982 / KCTC 12143 / HTCC2516) TaxID=314256 RepID=Q2CJ54_OCEGH|nr:RraA family protein [Oceanicola granulosus]EAR52746.1 Dimethylmenaquinone methyltransferase [Oceanicola granulosus HTCC2516]
MTDRDTLLATARAELYSAVVADTLDSLGHREQVVAPGLTALDDSLTMCGFARVGLYMPIYHDDETVNVYEHEIALVDDLKPGDVPVISCNGDLRLSPWGELLSTRAQVLGSTGCITDGCVRDVRQIREIGYPVHCGGRNPTDTKYRGKMMWTDVPCVIGGVRVESGDFVIADMDGIAFVPAAILDEVLSGALAKVRAETTVRDELRAGARLSEVFARHGIL